MDAAFNQHSQHSRSKNRSTTSLNHLSLAPLTMRLPIDDSEFSPDTSRPRTSYELQHTSSYIEGRSAPTTPRFLSRSNSRVSLKRVQKDTLSKSKSSTNVTTPTRVDGRVTSKARARAAKEGLTLSSLSNKDRGDSDWLLRAGALLSSEARESKGQSWLVSRASSTSLTAQRDEEEEALEKELAKERESRRNSMSRRNSTAAADADDEFSPLATRMSFGGSRSVSRFGSRAGSRTHSRRGSRVLFTPLTGLDMTREKTRDGYFDANEEMLAEPDFVDIDEELLYDADEAAQDDVIVKRLTKKGSLGLGTWIEQLIGWNLFAMDEDPEDTDNETEDEVVTDTSQNAAALRRRKDVLPRAVDSERVPPPANDEGGWKDAAWLLSIASKVIL